MVRFDAGQFQVKMRLYAKYIAVCIFPCYSHSKSITNDRFRASKNSTAILLELRARVRPLFLLSHFHR